MAHRGISQTAATLFLGGIFCLQSASAQPVTTCPVDKATTGFIPSLTEKYEIPGSGIRVFYALTGDNAIADKADVNSNGIPDYVENVARQAHAARRAYNLLGFRDPLQSARYRGATYIDVNVGAIAAYGLAWKLPSSYSLLSQREGVCSLRIDVSNSLSKFPGTWSTLAHELFHLYQYGYSMFSRSWLIEPTANWAERVIRTGTLSPAVPTTPLPATMAQVQSAVFSQSAPYDFWSRLASLMSMGDDSMQVPNDLRSALYTDGSAVFKDDRIRGFPFLSVVFQYLDAEDELVANESGLPEYLWSAADQTSAAHDTRILKAIQKAVKQTGIRDDEIDSFLAIE